MVKRSDYATAQGEGSKRINGFARDLLAIKRRR